MSSRIGFYYDGINADHFFHSCTEDATYIYTAWVSGALAGDGGYGTILKLAKADLSVAASYKVTERSGGANISIQRMILNGSYLYVWMLESSSLSVGISQLNVADLTHVATNWYSAVDSANMDALSMCYGTDANASPQNCLYCAGFNVGIGNYFRLLKIKDDLTLPTTYAWKDSTIGWPFHIKAAGTDLYVAGKVLQYGYIARLAQADNDVITLDRSTLFTTTDSGILVETILIDFVIDGDYIWAVGFIPRTGNTGVNDGVLIRFIKKDAGNGNRLTIDQSFRITNSSQHSYGCASIGIVGDFIYITTSPLPHMALGDDLDPTSVHETAIIALDKSDAEAGTATIKWARGISNSSGTANSGMMWGLLSSAGDYYGCGWSRIIKDASDNRSAMVYKNDVSDWGTDTTTYYGLNGIVMEENVASDITITSVTLTPTYGTSNTLSSITATPDASEPAWAAASGSYAVNSTNIDLLDEQTVIYIYPAYDQKMAGSAMMPDVVGSTVAGSSHAQAVDDPVGANDGDLTYVGTSFTSFCVDMFQSTFVSTYAGYITQVSLNVLARLDVTGNATFMKLGYTTGGSTLVASYSTEKALSTSTWSGQSVIEWILSTYNPNPVEFWENLHSTHLYFGFGARGNLLNPMSLTQCYIKVVWAPYATLNQTMIYCETAISAISLTQVQSLGMTNIACLCQMSSPLTLSMGWALVPGNPICLTQLTSPITLSMGWGLVPGNITCLTQITSPLTLTMCFALVPGSPTCLTQLTSPLNLTQRQVLGMTNITCLTQITSPLTLRMCWKLIPGNITCLTNYGAAVITVQRVLGLNSLACTTKISDISLSNKLTLSVPSIIIPCAISLTSINLNAGLTLSITSLACETVFGIPIFTGEREWFGERQWETETLYLIQHHYLAIGNISCLTNITSIALETAGAIELINSNIICLTNLSLTSLTQDHSLGMTNITCLTNISSISLTLHQHLNLSITSIQCSALITSLSLQQKIQIGIQSVVCSTYITPLMVSRLTNLTVGSMTCLTSISTIILNQIHNLELVSIGCDVNITGINLTLVTPGFDILTISNLNCDTFISSIDFTQDFMLIPGSPTCLCSISIPDILVAHTLTISSMGCSCLISPINLSLSYLMTVDDINCSTTISIINLSVSIADYGLTVASVICPTSVTSIELSLAQNLLLNSITCLCHITSIAFPMLGPIRRPSISSITRSRTIRRRM